MDEAERDAAMVIDGDVHVLPARATTGRIAAVTRHTVSWSAEAAQLLDIQVQQVAGCGVLVAVGWFWRIQLGQSAQASAFENPCHRAMSQAQARGDLSIRLSTAATFDNLIDAHG